MKLFFDTSALVKFFHEEEGTSQVSALIESDDNNIWISELARVEFISALYRRVRNKEITEDQLTEALSGFTEELTTFNCEPFGHAVITEAESLLKQYGKAHGLRTLDALQLGVFSIIAEKDWVLVSADSNLCRVAQLQGYKTINPVHGIQNESKDKQD
ncbi:MAG: type II toxin-antitoxin system VapC family toxin [Nitrospirae bacterium]|nr:type II toxin-antitoxin system VapC family toxin [Nitrospirota bacterium]